MNSKNYGRSVLRYVLVSIVALVAIFPTYWMVTMAFKPLAEWTSAAGVIYWWPQNPTLENFQKLLSPANSQFFSASSFYAWPAIRSSSIVSVGGTLFAMIIGVFAAYGLSRYDDSKGDFPWYIALGRLGVLVVALMPLMLLWSRLNIINTWYGIASIVIIGIFVDDLIAQRHREVLQRFSWQPGVFHSAIAHVPAHRHHHPRHDYVGGPAHGRYLVWSCHHLRRGHLRLCRVADEKLFRRSARELDEAAIVDGASYWGAFFKVVLPLAKGGIAATALFVFILNWSDFLVALFLTNRKWVTIPVFLNRLATAETGTQYGPKAALGVIALIPVLLFGIMIQKYLVRGLTFGAIKK